MVTNFYRDLAKAASSQNLKQPNSSTKSTLNKASALPPDFATHFGSSKNPDFTKLQDMMLEYENDHLKTLSNI